MIRKIAEIVELVERMDDEQREKFIVYLEAEIEHIRQLSAKPPDRAPQ